MHSVSELNCKAGEAYLVTGRRRWRTGRLASSCFSLLLVFCSPDGSVSGTFPPSPLFPGFFVRPLVLLRVCLSVRSIPCVFLVFSVLCVFCSRCSCLSFCVRFPWSSFSFLSSGPPCPCVFVLLCPPPLLFFCSFPPCSFSSVRPCSALWFFLLFFFFSPPFCSPFSGFYKARECMIMSDLREWRPARSPLFEEKPGAKSPVIASPILAFRDRSCG